MASKNEVPQPLGIKDVESSLSKNGDTTTKPTPVYSSDDKESRDNSFAVAAAIEEAATLPKGTIDPVYEAKAKVLNKAVSLHFCNPSLDCSSLTCRY